MNLSFEIGKKAKWAIVGASLLLVGWILAAIGHNEPSVATVLGYVSMVVGGVLDVVILARAVFDDLEEDSYS